MSEGAGVLLVVLAALLALSGAFSASETALFSLTGADRGRAGTHAARLLDRPRSLLVTILLCNLLVNVLFFAFSSELAVEGDPASELLVGFGALVAILVAGEILPKSLALRAAAPIARATALPLALLVAFLRPVRALVNALLELVFRALGRAAEPEPGLTTGLLARVLEQSGERGLIEPGEADLLGEILELAGVRVRELMTPRVDMVAVDLAEPSTEAVVRRALDEGRTWLPVIEGSPDNVLGGVRVRELLAEPQRSVRQLVMPVLFVPEVASALDLLRVLRERHASVAIVVDEWGGTAGLVTIEDVFEEIVGDLRVEGEARKKPVVPLGEGVFRVDGGLSVRDWNEAFGVQFVPKEFETVGGLIAAKLGRIPRAGDRVEVGDLVCEVHAARGRRVVEVDMWVEEGAAT